MTTSFFVNNGGNTSARETISADLTASTNSKNDAEKYAVHPEDATYTLSDGVTTGKSALHYQAKAEDSQLAAAQSEANASASAGIANAAKLAAQAAEAAVSSASSGYVTETGSQTISGVKTFTTNPVFSSGLTVASLVSNGAVTPDSIGMADGKIIGFGASEDRGNNWNGVAQGNHFDLEIRHDGSNSYIKDFGTGNLAIEAADLSLRDDSNNRRVYCTDGASGSVALYYGDSSSGSKLDTANTGVNVTGKLTSSSGIDITGEIKGDTLDIDGAVDIDTGNSNFDVNTGSGVAFFTSSNIARQFIITCENATDTAAPDLVLRRKGLVSGDENYSAGNIRFEAPVNETDTNSNEYTTGMPYAIIQSQVKDNAAGLNTRADADAVLRFLVQDGDNTAANKEPSEKLEIHKDGITVTGTITADGLTMLDSEKITLGTGGDLEIYHDGSDSIITEAGSGTGDLLIRGNNLKLQKGDGAEDYLVATMNGSVAIKHDSATKLETSSGGITVTGTASSDKVEVGSPVTTGAAVLAVEADTSSLNPVSISNSRNTASTDYSIIFYRNTNIVGSIQTTLSATSYLTTSDYRLKNNVTYDWDATTRLKQLKPARFEFVSEPGVTVDGFLAHEVSGAVPEAVTGVKDETDDAGYNKYQGIDQSKLVPLLVKTIQELEARITALES
tara:strand:+ start:1813 stop:3834 length:2022 start_codon:yes stop_codon:yes gene_type:complete